MYITDNSKLAHLFNNHYINIVENTSGMPPEFFFLLGFSSQTLTIHRTAGEGRGPSFIPLYHFDLLTNIRHLFTTLYVRWLSHIFNCNACVYQTATQWDLPPYQITIWVIDWWCNVCLFTWWSDSRFSGLEISAGHQTMSDVKPGMSDAKSPYTWQSWPTCFRAVKNTLLTVWYIISLCAY